MKNIIDSRDYFLPFQKRWINDESPMKLYPKSRRIGITYGTSYRANRKCLMKGPGFVQYVSSRDLPTAKDFVAKYIAKWASLANAVATGLMGENVQVIDPEKGIQAFVVKYSHGPEIVSLSSTPEAFAGKGGDILLDEVDLHEDPGKLLDMAIPCTTWGNQLEGVSAYSVDGSPDSVFAKLVADAMGSNPMHWSLHFTTLVDAINEGYVEKINEVTGSHWTRDAFLADCRAKCRNEAAFRSQYMCEPCDEGGTLLSYDLIRNNESQEATMDCDFEMLRRCKGDLYLGYDVARKKDLGVLWLDEVLGDVSITRVVRRFRDTPFRVQLDALCRYFELPRLRRGCIDATGMGAMLAESLTDRFKYLVQSLTMTAPVKEALAMLMLQSFQDRQTRNPAEDGIREALHKVRKTVSPTGSVRYEGERDDSGHADEFWARAYALEARSKRGAKTYFNPVPFDRERLTGSREEALCV